MALAILEVVPPVRAAAGSSTVFLAGSAACSAVPAEPPAHPPWPLFRRVVYSVTPRAAFPKPRIRSSPMPEVACFASPWAVCRISRRYQKRRRSPGRCPSRKARCSATPRGASRVAFPIPRVRPSNGMPPVGCSATRWAACPRSTVWPMFPRHRSSCRRPTPTVLSSVTRAAACSVPVGRFTVSCPAPIPRVPPARYPPASWAG